MLRPARGLQWVGFIHCCLHGGLYLWLCFLCCLLFHSAFFFQLWIGAQNQFFKKLLRAQESCISTSMQSAKSTPQ